MRIELNDEEVREAIGEYLKVKEITVLDSTIKFSVDDYEGRDIVGDITFSAEVE